MERKAYILQELPSEQQFRAINNCRRVSWELDGVDYYPYKEFGQRQNWQRGGDLGEALLAGKLHVALAEDENGETVAHVAMVANKYGWEFGRVMSSKEGHDYGLSAAEALREHIEGLGIKNFARGTSGNRTAVWKTFERAFGAHGWDLAVLGLLPDIYNEPKGNPNMQWGEIISRAVKGEIMILPPAELALPAYAKFAEGIEALNGSWLQFGEDMPKENRMPYPFGENTYAIAWNDRENQQKFWEEGYIPVGIILLNDNWHFVVFKGELPPKIAGRAHELRRGRSPMHYPEEAAGVPVGKIMDFIYKYNNERRK